MYGRTLGPERAGSESYGSGSITKGDGDFDMAFSPCGYTGRLEERASIDEWRLRNDGATWTDRRVGETVDHQIASVRPP